VGTPRDFDQFLKQELNIRAVWLPSINTFRPGDNRVISDGVLLRVGKIADDLGSSFDQARGPASGMRIALRKQCHVG
jgi:hypothetical protein